MATKLIWFNVLNALDLILSIVCLKLGFGLEFNPVMNMLLGNLPLFIFVKLFGAFILSLWIGRKTDKYSNIASWIALIVMFGVVAWNVGVVITATL